MEGLDLLKKDWDKEKNFPKVSENQIYKMIHKKSSSIVKWIFIISVLEILFWTVISVVMSDEKHKQMLTDYHLDTFMVVYSVVHWSILICFIVFFYKNFKRISNMSSAKILMKNILKVRKLMKYYIWYNIVGMVFSIIIVGYFMIKYDNNFNTIMNQANTSGTETGIWVGIIVFFIIMIVFMGGFLWLFYRIIYGILLKRLHKNYVELEKMEL